MELVNISRILPTSAGISESQKFAKDSVKGSEQLFIASLHIVAMNSWGQFAATRKKAAQKNEAAHRLREQRNQELEAQKKQTEYRASEMRGAEYRTIGVDRQAAQFCIYDGEHFGDHRHLQTTV